MATDYEALYGQSPQALGAPSKVFIDFFDTFSKPQARVLDIGCGQGRDALFIARLGHQVTGVDVAPSGIAGLLADATAEGLPIIGEVADIRQYQPDGLFDVILIDRTLHMLNAPDRLAVLETLLNHCAENGFLLIADESSNMPGFRNVLSASLHDWTPVLEKPACLFVQRAS